MRPIPLSVYWSESMDVFSKSEIQLGQCSTYLLNKRLAEEILKAPSFTPATAQGSPLTQVPLSSPPRGCPATQMSHQQEYPCSVPLPLLPLRAHYMGSGPQHSPVTALTTTTYKIENMGS